MMSPNETAIAENILSDIKAATSTDRKVLVDELYTFYGVVEKRVALSTGSFAAKCMADVKGLVGKIETGAEEVVSGVESALNLEAAP